MNEANLLHVHCTRAVLCMILAYLELRTRAAGQHLIVDLPQSSRKYNTIFTLCTCTRGKEIGLSVCHLCPQKITRSQDIGVLMSGHCCQDIAKKQ